MYTFAKNVAVNFQNFLNHRSDGSRVKFLYWHFSDDDLVPYDMSNDTKFTKVKQPKYIRDCMEGKNYHKLHIGLMQLIYFGMKWLLAIMSIGFLANHRLCKHPQNQLVRVYQCLFTTFPLHLIHSSMVWYFQNNFESLINEVILL